MTIDTASLSAAPAPPHASALPAPFNLTRRFALLALAGIALVSIVSALLLARFMTEQMLHRDGEITAQFVQNLLTVERGEGFFRGAPEKADLEFFQHLAIMPDVIHANVYGADRTVLWSTKPEMVGQKLGANHELDEALEGELEIESDLIEEQKYFKPEHLYLPKTESSFVENYVPIFDAKHEKVLGVVELYRTPRALFEDISQLLRRIWASALIAALVLFVPLLWLTRRADRIMREQQRKLVEAETLAAVGEMAAAVAHSIRNPLAAIRSSAELAQGVSAGEAKQPLQDIINGVDRIAAWVKNLLIYSQPRAGKLSAVDLSDTIQSCLNGFAREFAKRGIVVASDLAAASSPVLADPALLTQALNSVIANAIEAMPNGGRLELALRGQGRRVILTLVDSGVGIAPEQLDKVFVPFHTSKQDGLGVGLPLVRRVMERFGGSIELRSALGQGTTVTVQLQAASV